MPTSVFGALGKEEHVKVPFRSKHYTAFTAGTSTATHQVAGIRDNEDGTGTGVALSVATALTNGAGVKFQFYGRYLGIRIDRSGTLAGLSVCIDGKAYPVRQTTNRIHNSTTSVQTDGESLLHVADGLDPDIVHTAEVYLAPDIGGSSRAMTLTGYVVERAAGYENKPRLTQVLTKQALTTSLATFTATSGGNPTDVRGIRKVLYVNTDSSARRVTVGFGGDTVKTLDLAAAGSAGDTGEFDLGNLTASTLTHKADAGSVVNAFGIGGY